MNPNEHKSETPETDAMLAALRSSGRETWGADDVAAFLKSHKKLERERDQARRDLEVSIEQLNRIADRVVEKQAELDQLRARVGELEKDKERLDWLEKLYHINGTVLIPVVDDWSRKTHVIEVKGSEIRQAIDDAMKGQE